MSLPAWECGLKYRISDDMAIVEYVTPCVGVWIEILRGFDARHLPLVTPCVGVWIEIFRIFFPAEPLQRHSLRGSVD